MCECVYADIVIVSAATQSQHGRNVFAAAELLVDTYVSHKSLGTFGSHVCLLLRDNCTCLCGS